ncbi:hypothetical protein Syun_014006 [Stephania yunnanensis]|uniref:16S rRNA (uracil(1498)-N(3))-methyltransferase n=1 Tax=Stephania yunnanensis TaxID=152371 RepID=A0AAP0JIH1_9MAGN
MTSGDCAAGLPIGCARGGDEGEQGTRAAATAWSGGDRSAALARAAARFGGAGSGAMMTIVCVGAQRTSSLSAATHMRASATRFVSLTLLESCLEVVVLEEEKFYHLICLNNYYFLVRVELFNGKGGVVEGVIQQIDRTGLDFMALKDPRVVHSRNTQWHVFAAFGTLKGDRADWLVEKCTELGACSLTPLLTERSPSISENRIDRLQRVILAAVKQCQRLHEMALNPPTKVGCLLPVVAKSSLSFLATAEATPLFDALTSKKNEASGLIIIGPEGDLTEKEVKMLTEVGADTVGLGPHRLRVETATVTLLASLMLWSNSKKSVDN